MIASRFTKAFQLLALVLVFTMVQVYVMAGPIRGNTDPKTTDTSAGQPKAATVATDSSTTGIATTTATGNILPTPEAAAEKMALRAGSKTALSRIFSKQDVTARIASENSFLKTNASLAGTFKTRAAQSSSAQTNNQSGDDNDEGSKRGMWIAVGIIGAVLAIAVIGLRHDRGPGRGNGNQ
jgi:hypothetical protein